MVMMLLYQHDDLLAEDVELHAKEFDHNLLDLAKNNGALSKFS